MLQTHLTTDELLLAASLGQWQPSPQMVFNEHPAPEASSFVVALATWLAHNFKAELALGVCWADEVVRGRTANYVGAMHLIGFVGFGV